MMKRFFYFLLFPLLVSCIYISCVKQKNYPIVPSIAFKQFIKYDTIKNGVNTLCGADCIITFKDGDGDIGLLSGDTVPDLKMVYLYKGTDGKFHPYDQNFTEPGFDTLIFHYSVPDLTPQGQYKALEGEIRIQMHTIIALPQHTAFKYAIILCDRAGHYSNWAFTDEIPNP